MRPSKVDVIDKRKPTADKVESFERSRSTADKGGAFETPKPIADKVEVIEKPKPTPDKVEAIDKPKPSAEKVEVVETLKPAPDKAELIGRPKPNADKVAVVETLKPAPAKAELIDKPKPSADQPKASAVKVEVIDRPKPTAEMVELSETSKAMAGPARQPTLERPTVPRTGAAESPGQAASIVLDDVHVSFPIYNTSGRSLRHHVMSASTGGRIGADAQQRVVVEALSGVSFSLSHGDRVALVGHNGAGKTTLLRVIAGIYAPWKGRVDISGRIAPLFDVGLGIDAESTGYENIRLRGLYLGLTRAQIEARAESIASFTELGPFLHMPVRTYSAGMQARLAFAVSTSINPEILLLDEGIVAGDASFMEKANQRLHQFIESSGIMVLASHSDALINRFCNKAMLLERGRVLRFGPVDEVLAAYRG